MGLRFRKSFKVAPGVKVNLNKKSSSVTFGGKGAHYTVNSKGKRTKSVGIPGSGMYYTETSGGSSGTRTSSSGSSGKDSTQKKHGCLIPIIVIILFFVLVSLIPDSDSDELASIELSADTDTVYDIGQSVSITLSTDPENYDIPEDAFHSSGGNVSVSDGEISFSSDSAGYYNVWVEDGDIASNTLSFSVEDRSVDEAESSESDSNTSSVQQSSDSQEEETQPQEQMVWIPQSGSKYHSNSTCSGMENPTQVTISEAESRGYEPCKKCF